MCYLIKIVRSKTSVCQSHDCILIIKKDKVKRGFVGRALFLKSSNINIWISTWFRNLFVFDQITKNYNEFGTLFRT